MRFRCNSLHVCASYCGAAAATATAPQFEVSFARGNYTIKRGTTQMPSSFQTVSDNENSQKEHKFHSDVKTTTENRNICWKKQQNTHSLFPFKQIQNSDAHYNVCFDIMT